MTREEMDALDRRIAGITAPGAYGEGMAALDRAVGNPIASYSLDDLRRMFLRGQAPAATPGAMPAAVEAMIPATPTDALRGPAMPGPVAAAPLPPPPALPVMPSGTRPVAPVMPSPVPRPQLDPRAAAELARTPAIVGAMPSSARAEQIPAVQMDTLPGEASAAGARLTPQQLALAIQRYGRMDLDPTSFAYRFARTQR